MILLPYYVIPFIYDEVKYVIILKLVKIMDGLDGLRKFGSVIWIIVPIGRGIGFVMFMYTEFGDRYWQFLLPIPLPFIAILHELIVEDAKDMLIYVGN